MLLIVNRIVTGEVRVGGTRQMLALFKEIGEAGMPRAVCCNVCLLSAHFKKASSKIVRNILHFISRRLILLADGDIGILAGLIVAIGRLVQV